jgi:hypothetical protein
MAAVSLFARVWLPIATFAGIEHYEAGPYGSDRRGRIGIPDILLRTSRRYWEAIGDEWRFLGPKLQCLAY